jgi:FAD dependent oxidoreductase
LVLLRVKNASIKGKYASIIAQAMARSSMLPAGLSHNSTKTARTEPVQIFVRWVCMKTLAALTLCLALDTVNSFGLKAPLAQSLRTKSNTPRGVSIMSSASTEERIVILGGGIIGSSIAYHLTKRGIQPILVERSKVAAAASGKVIRCHSLCDSHKLLSQTS